MSIAILGGTGPQGRGLALRFARAGIPVVIGSRDGTRAQSVADELNAQLGGDALIGGKALRDAVVAADEMAILAVPYSAHDATLEAIRDCCPARS
ncbi:prephenate dehydrogenase [Halomonas elongata]|uniref:Prephenate dehydrogenase n=1 Tax=Halomonas elongata TaxID=2746 RepID=A0A1B8P7D9_HALEL|nr:NAD(P)-binding domain-containing protein [Halomonas elongata]OBX38148.1 prephenate dehydrogenase [Halomonas elongata]